MEKQDNVSKKEKPKRRIICLSICLSQQNFILLKFSFYSIFIPLLLAQFLQGLEPRCQLIVSRGDAEVACHFLSFFFFSTRINLTLAPLHPSPPLDRASSKAGEPPFISGPPAPLSLRPPLPLPVHVAGDEEFRCCLFSCSLSNYMSNLFSRSTRPGDFCESLPPEHSVT